MKRKYRDYLILIITTLVIVFITTRFTYLFGSNTDYINQHTIIPDYFRQLFYSTGRLIPDFTFNYSAGENIFNLSYYGFLSPLILPSYLLPFLDMVTYMNIVDILVVIASGILFYNWLKQNNYSDNITLITSLLFITAGPLIFHMHRHIMFVNYMPFLIMGLIGVDRLIKDNKKTLLVIGTFLMIMTSYYYSVCGLIILGIYYIYKYLNSNKKEFIKDLIKFIGILLIPVFMSSILIVPTFYTLLSGRNPAEKINIVRLFIPNLGIHRIFCGTYSIGLSLIGFIALLYLFTTKNKNNIIFASLISIVLFIPIFMFVLNGGLYLKEKCFIPFLPLISYILAYFLTDLYNNKVDTKKLGKIVLIAFVVVFSSNMNRFCMITLPIYGILFLKYDKKMYKLLIIFLLGLSFTTQIVENLYEDMVTMDLYNEIFDKDIENTIKNVLNSDDSFYRSNNLHYPTKTINKIYNHNYFTTNTYSSTYNRAYLDFVKKELRDSSKDYNYFMISPSSNIMFNTFFGVKYLYSDYDIPLYEKYNGMYKNDNVLPILYASNHIMNDNEFEKLKFPRNQEALLNNVIVDKKTNNKIESNIEKIDLEYEILEKNGVELIKNKKGYILEVKDKGNIKIKINELKDKILFISVLGLKPNKCSEDNISMKINNIENILTCLTWPYPNNNNIFRYTISDTLINELDVELTKGTYNISKIDTYIMDNKYVKNVKNNITEFDNIIYNDNVITGDIKLEEDSYIVTSIPYTDGYNIKVNGKEINYEKVNKAFIGFPLEKGLYNVEISFNAPLLNESKIISLTSLLIFVFIELKDRIKLKKYN